MEGGQGGAAYERVKRGQRGEGALAVVAWARPVVAVAASVAVSAILLMLASYW